jgi:hypothetical protein
MFEMMGQLGRDLIQTRREELLHSLRPTPVQHRPLCGALPLIQHLSV